MTTAKNIQSYQEWWKRINGIFSLGDVIVETQLFLFSKQTLQDFAGKQNMLYILKIKSYYFLTKYQAWVFPHVCKILTLLPAEISREIRAGERRDSMLSRGKYCRLNGIYFYLGIWRNTLYEMSFHTLKGTLKTPDTTFFVFFNAPFS